MKRLTLRAYNALLDAIYEAPFTGRWDHVLEMLSREAGDINTHLFGHDIAANRSLSVSSSRYDPDLAEPYYTYYHERNAWVPGVARSRVGKATNSQDYLPLSELKRTEFYADWLRPQEEIVGGGGILLFNDNRRFVNLGGNIREKDMAGKEEEWLELLDLLAPHLTRAFRVYLAVAQTAQSQGGYGLALEGIGYAAFLLQAGGRVAHANAAALRMERAGAIARRDRGGRLHLTDPQADRIVHDGIAAIQRRSAEAAPDLIALRDPDGGAGHLAMLVPFGVNLSEQAEHWLAAAGDLPIALLLVRGPESASRSPGDLLAKLYRLTPAEAALASALADGSSLADYADGRGLSQNTVRNQLRAVFFKTGTSRQGELVALIGRLSA